MVHLGRQLHARHMRANAFVSMFQVMFQMFQIEDT